MTSGGCSERHVVCLMGQGYNTSVCVCVVCLYVHVITEMDSLITVCDWEVKLKQLLTHEQKHCAIHCLYELPVAHRL